jgi:hypothetical protein
LFVIVLDWVLRNALNDETLGLNLSRKNVGQKYSCRSNVSKITNLTDLCYADDIALVTDNVDNANTMLASISFWARKVGLKINTGKGKTEYILVGDFSKEVVNISVDDKVIAKVDDFKYLGSWIMSSEKDFLTRKGQAWTAVSKLDNIWRSTEFSKKMKFLFFQSLIESILFYNATTWTISSTLLTKITGSYHKLLRYALNVHHTQRLTNEEIFEGIDFVPVDVRLRKLRLTFVGHCWRCRTYSYQSISDLIFWKLHGSGDKKYYDMLLSDVSDLPVKSVNFLQNFMSRDKKVWHEYVNGDSHQYGKKKRLLKKRSRSEANPSEEAKKRGAKSKTKTTVIGEANLVGGFYDCDEETALARELRWRDAEVVVFVN